MSKFCPLDYDTIPPMEDVQTDSSEDTTERDVERAGWLPVLG